MYTVYDCYEGSKEFLATADNMREVRETAKERWYDTDGECQIWYEKEGKLTFLPTF